MQLTGYLAYTSYPLYRLRGGAFRFAGRELPYFCHRYNTTYLNERALEIPIARHYLKAARDVLEVGNVLNQYGYFRHDVVDKFEKCDGVTSCDVRDFETSRRYDLILSISTLEHVGWDERPKESPEAFHEAHAVLRSLLMPAGKLVFTVPLGYNTWLDNELRCGRVHMDEMHCFLRVDKRNRWREATFTEIANARYGHPFRWANAIVVGVNHGKEQAKQPE